MTSEYNVRLRSWFIERVELQRKIVLDAGCGRGMIIPRLLEERPAKIYALDINPECEGKVKAKTPQAEANRVVFICGNMTDMHFFSDDEIDVIVMNYLFDGCDCSEEDVQQMKLGLRECHRVLKKSNALVMLCDAPDDPNLDERHQKRFRLSDAVEELLGEETNTEDYPKEWLLSQITRAGFRIEHFAHLVNADIRSGKNAIENIGFDMQDAEKLEEPLRSAFLECYERLIEEFNPDELITKGFDNYQILAYKAECP